MTEIQIERGRNEEGALPLEDQVIEIVKIPFCERRNYFRVFYRNGTVVEMNEQTAKEEHLC